MGKFSIWRICHAFARRSSRPLDVSNKVVQNTLLSHHYYSTYDSCFLYWNFNTRQNFTEMQRAWLLRFRKGIRVNLRKKNEPIREGNTHQFEKGIRVSMRKFEKGRRVNFRKKYESVWERNTRQFEKEYQAIWKRNTFQCEKGIRISLRKEYESIWERNTHRFETGMGVNLRKEYEAVWKRNTSQLKKGIRVSFRKDYESVWERNTRQFVKGLWGKRISFSSIPASISLLSVVGINVDDMSSPSWSNS